MKVRSMLFGAMTMLFSTAIIAQDVEGFTDEELTKYAKVMKWAEEGTAQLQQYLTDGVNASEVLSAASYNTLSKALKADEDLTTSGVSEAEIAVFTALMDDIDQKKEAFTAEYKEKIVAEIGVSLYNRLKKALNTDAEVKARYEAIFDGLANSGESGME